MKKFNEFFGADGLYGGIVGMSCGFILVRKVNSTPAVDLINTVGLIDQDAASSGESTIDDCVDMDSLLVAESAPWVFAFGEVSPFLDEQFYGRVEEISRGGQAFVVTSVSAVSGLMFCAFVNGVKVRDWCEIENEIQHNEGDPLPGENGLFTSELGSSADFWKVIVVAEAFAGVRWNDLCQIRAEVYPARLV